MIRIKPSNEYLVHSHDVDLVYKAIITHIESLETYLQWVDKTALPENKNARLNISEEIIEYRKLSYDIYHHIITTANATIERNREYPNYD